MGVSEGLQNSLEKWAGRELMRLNKGLMRFT